VELEHDFNLGGAAAVFYGQEEQEGADPFPPVELSADGGRLGTLTAAHNFQRFPS
jgi:hypothetical protein